MTLRLNQPALQPETISYLCTSCGERGRFVENRGRDAVVRPRDRAIGPSDYLVIEPATVVANVVSRSCSAHRVKRGNWRVFLLDNPAAWAKMAISGPCVLGSPSPADVREPQRYVSGDSMNKADLVDRIAGACTISKSQATTAIDTAVDSITAALRKGDRVALIGFGTFSVSQRKARNGRNPQTGATIKIAARRVAKFTPGNELKKVVNKGK
jgi:DNA-binding protein HU-beta